MFIYLYDPTVTFYEHKALFDFTEDFGFMIILDLETQTITDTITPKDPFFLGFIKLSKYINNHSTLLRDTRLLYNCFTTTNIFVSVTRYI